MPLSNDVVEHREAIVGYAHTPLGGDVLSRRIPREKIDEAAEEATKDGISFGKHAPLARSIALAECINRSQRSLNCRKAHLMAADRDYRTQLSDLRGNEPENEEDGLPYPVAIMASRLLGLTPSEDDG